MGTHLILTFLADDRPGLVDTLSHAVADAGGNWLESRTAEMVGKFAGIAHVALPDLARASDLKGALAALKAVGITVVVDDAPAAADATGPALVITLVGPDQPGIVRDIAHCLAAHRASIDTMDTEVSDAPMGGGSLFHARIAARLPAGVEDDALRAELERIAGALMVDIDWPGTG